MTTLRCRSSENEKEPLLVYLTATQLLNLKLKNGELCLIRHPATGDSHEAVAWLAGKADQKDSQISISRLLLDRINGKTGGEVVSSKVDRNLQNARLVHFKCNDPLPDTDLLGWEFVLTKTIQSGCKYLADRQKVFATIAKERKEFEVITLGSEGNIHKIEEVTQAKIGDASPQTNKDKVQITGFASIGGLREQIRKVRSIIKLFLQDVAKSKEQSTESCRQGLVLHGPAGTGKTMLRQAIEHEFTWIRIHTKVAEVFETVKSGLVGPVLLQLDLLTKPSAAEVGTLRELFATPVDTSIFVLAEIRDVNDLPSYLRSSTCFSRELEITAPGVEDRLDILKLKTNQQDIDVPLQDIASRTHGFTGDDLQRLLHEFRLIAAERKPQLPPSYQLSETNDHHHARFNGSTNGQISDFHAHPSHSSSPYSTITHADLSLVLKQIRPSALQTLTLTTPNTPFSSIGGLQSHKHRLFSAVTWPLQYPNHLSRLGIKPKKGILLYGPPGCSKTMLVKALATESSYNFLAVKGAELVSMYVGESERATRDVFRKARSAGKCIVFFDEIDSIASKRGSSSTATGGSELNVLTTLLNEMDGIEELRDVLVVAATNKPWQIDPALMRPGRFDNVVYVGLPDSEARKAIVWGRVRGLSEGYSEEMREETRVEEVARSMEGMSGAEVVGVCEMAGEIALERGLAAEMGGDRIDEAEFAGGMNGHSVDTNSVRSKEVETEKGNKLNSRLDDIRISYEDLLQAVSRTPKSISVDMLEEYERWNEARARSAK